MKQDMPTHNVTVSLLRQGKSPADVWDILVSRGTDAETAERLIREVLRLGELTADLQLCPPPRHTQDSDIDRVVRKLQEGSFHLNPPLSEAAVVGFESEQGVQLPEAYRLFLTRAGNGGAGPWGELMSLPASSALPLGCLSAPSRLLAGPATSNLAEVELDYDIGTLPLADSGCGCFDVLVVSGSYRGRVVGTGEGAFLYGAVDFLDWYETWLDDQLGIRAGRGAWYQFLRT